MSENKFWTEYMINFMTRSGGTSPNTVKCLIRHNVGIKDIKTFTLKCLGCGQVFQPQLKEGGRLPRRYWECPNGCNT